MAKSTTNSNKRLQLSIEQLNAIDLLVTGKTDQKVADSVGVHRVTVTKWRRYNPYFKAELNRRRQEIWGSAADRLRSMVPDALDILERELQAGNRQSAATVLRLAGFDKLGKPDDPVEANEILDQMARKREMELLFPSLVLDRQAVLDDLEQKLSEEP